MGNKHEDPAELDGDLAGKDGKPGPMKDPTKDKQGGKHGGGKK